MGIAERNRAIGKPGLVKRGKALDCFYLVGASLCVAAAIPAAFAVAHRYNIGPAWVFGVVAAVPFFVVVGSGYRSKFRSPAFVVFFTVWMIAHVAVYLWVLAYLGLLYYIPICVLEMWIGSMVAIWRFGPPPDRSIR
jgi:hypothetical protein